MYTVYVKSVCGDDYIWNYTNDDYTTYLFDTLKDAEKCVEYLQDGFYEHYGNKLYADELLDKSIRREDIRYFSREYIRYLEV